MYTLFTLKKKEKLENGERERERGGETRSATPAASDVFRYLTTLTTVPYRQTVVYVVREIPYVNI